jgi:hypothetical protein
VCARLADGPIEPKPRFACRAPGEISTILCCTLRMHWMGCSYFHRRRSWVAWSAAPRAMSRREFRLWFVPSGLSFNDGPAFLCLWNLSFPIS